MSSVVLDGTRRTSSRVLLLFVVLDYMFVSVAMVLFAAGAFTPVAEATHGLVNRALLANLVLLGVLVGGVMVRLGRLRACDIGLVWSGLPLGIAVTVGMWVVIQMVEAAVALGMEGRVTLAAAWSQVGVTAMVGLLLAQVLGNALYEDIAYRGFLLPQLVLKARERWPGQAWRGLIVGLVVSQVLFALRHVPGEVSEGASAVSIAGDVVRLTLLGVVLALLYLRSGNLFIVIGVHVLMDAPTAVVASTLIGPSYLATILAVVLLLLWPRPHTPGPPPSPDAVETAAWQAFKAT